MSEKKDRRTPWTDISVPIWDGMVTWPGDPPVAVTRVQDVTAGEQATVRSLSLGSHTGTHVDAPAHFLPDGENLDTWQPDRTVGPARLLELDSPHVIGRAELEACDIAPGERLLLRTRNSQRRWWLQEFDTDFVHLSVEAAEYLRERRPRLVGIDYLSVSGYHDDPAVVHRALLGADVWILEGLDLTQVKAGRYELLCLPLPIAAGDGAPARALLRPARGAQSHV